MGPHVPLELLLRPASGGVYFAPGRNFEHRGAIERRFYAADSSECSAEFRANLERVAGARVVLVGVPSDSGGGFRRGASLGPAAIRQRLDLEPEWRALVERGEVLDIGDTVVVPQLLDDAMLAPEQLTRCRTALYPDVAEPGALPVSPLSVARSAFESILDNAPNAKILVLGGDHSCAWPLVQALHQAYGSCCIVQLDAHTDLSPERQGVSVCFATWSFHANALLSGAERLIQVGIRASQRPKEHWQTLGVKQFWADEVRAAPASTLDQIVAAAKATQLPVYLSNDIDGTSDEFADATGTPEPEGLEPAWVATLIQRLGAETPLIAADVMEVAPPLGRDGGRVTVQTAASYVLQSAQALLAR
jgi:arginase family enzyme